jgi:hypothetical protein
MLLEVGNVDMYDYFVSKDIANYCKKIGHRFNPLEMAVIVAHSDHKSREERHMGWRQIIEEYPDMPIPGRPWFDARDSLRDSLLDQIAWEEKWIADFYTPGEDILYYSSSSGYCFSVEKAWDCIKDREFYKSYGDIGIEKGEMYTFSDKFVVSRNRINGSDDRTWVHLNTNGDVAHFSGLDSLECPCNLFHYHIDLPVPFEMGDLLTLPDDLVMLRGKKPFVLKEELLWRKPEYGGFLSGKTDKWDGRAYLYYSMDGHSGGLKLEQSEKVDDIWRLRYFKGELEGHDRFLGYLSQHIKNGCDRMDWLINTFLKFEKKTDYEDMKHILYTAL